jgi:hypothetical protein
MVNLDMVGFQTGSDRRPYEVAGLVRSELGRGADVKTHFVANTVEEGEGISICRIVNTLSKASMEREAAVGRRVTGGHTLNRCQDHLNELI